jgi:hypothetical protein
MAWKIKIGDKSMLLDDLSPDDLVAACVGHPEINWLRLYNSPAANPAAFYSLVCAVARKLEVPSPDRPQTAREAVEFLQHVEQVDDDLPTAFAEGGIPLEAPDAPATTTSSTSTAPAVGAPSKRDARP